jgi:prepilin-type N-terminal cleavage/methylation domain-containing protein
VFFRRRPGVSGKESGFTLIEILIVISIISILASLVLVMLTRVRNPVNESLAHTDIATLSQALANYVADEAEYPGQDLKPEPDRNDFPLLYEALFGERRPRGKGGRNAPYADFKENRIAVYNPDSNTYRKPTRKEFRDPDVKKYLLDSWKNPYIYRCNRASPRMEPWMHKDADIYSLGSNEEDDTVNLLEAGDDIGNW